MSRAKHPLMAGVLWLFAAGAASGASKIGNVQLQLRTAEPDLRHALVCEDVEDMSIDRLDAKHWPNAAATIRLKQAKGVQIRGCREGTTVDRADGS